MHIFVCGKLGEVIKKVVELENAIKNSTGNVVLVAELAAYNEILQLWPVSNKDELDHSVDIFRFCLANLKEKEKELREQHSVSMYDMMAKNKYLQALDETRANMSYINELGMYAGSSPVLEVEDAHTTSVVS